MIIVLIGPPGSGKGTQGRILSECLGIELISVGDMLRKLANSEGEKNALLHQYMSEGKLVPVELVNEVVQTAMSSKEYSKGCLLDGYPRSVEQAKFLESFVQDEIKVIYFEVDDQVVVKRLAGRFTCASCGEIYNTYYAQPKKEGVCDICNSDKFIHRRDDEENVIVKRIAEYKNETYPLVEYYKDRGNFYLIDASKRKEEVEIAIESLLKII